MESIQEMQLYELYYIVLLSKKYGEEEMSYDMDTIWNDINKYYYLDKGIFNDDRDSLFEWMKNKERYHLLDELMLQVFDKFINKENVLDKTDKFFISNVLEMKKIMEEHSKYRIYL